MKTNLLPLYSLIIGILLLQVLVLPVSAQQRGVGGHGPVQIKFLKDSLTVQENAFAFNSINLSNVSGTILHLQMQLSVPGFLNLISSSGDQVILQPGESRILPIRFGAGQTNSSVSWSPFGINLRVAETNESYQSTFLVRLAESRKWKADLRQPVLSLTDADRKAVFNVRIRNNGNIADTYVMNIATIFELSVPKKDYRINLQPGEEKDIQIGVDLLSVDIRQIRQDEIQLFIRSGNGEQQMLILPVIRTGSIYTGNTPAWKMMPLTVGLNLFNLSSGQVFGYLTAQGYLDLGKDRLNVLIQTDNYYRDGNTANTHFAAAEYTHGPLKITAGSILDYNNFLVDGAGLRLRYNGKQDSYEGMAVQSRLGNTQQYNFKANLTIGRGLHLTNNTFANLDKAARENGYLTLNRLTWDLDKNNHLSLEAGAGMQNIYHKGLDTLLAGPQGGYHFESKGKFYQLISGISLYSKNFPGINKGFVYQLHEARILAGHYYAGPYLEVNRRNYNDARDSIISLLFNIDNREYGLRAGWQGGKGTIVLSPGFFRQRQDSSASFAGDMYKLSLTMNWQFSPKLWLSLLSSAGRVNITGIPGAPVPFTSISNFATLQYGSYGLQLRYDHGPFYYYEMRQYLNTQKMLERVQLMSFAEIQVPRWGFYSRLQVNYMHEAPTGIDMLYAYGNFQYSSSANGWAFGLAAGASLKGYQEPMINVSIRKRLLAPVFKNNSSRNFKVILFLDANGNNKPDPGEKRVVNATLLVDDKAVMTNENGEIEFVNTNEDALRFDFSHISGLRGWMPLGGYRQILRPGKDKVFVLPFMRSRVLTGHLTVIRDRLSAHTMETGGIRVIAKGVHGEEYTTITDADGGFYFNLTAGQYLISVNQAVLDKDFHLVEPEQQADLAHNETLDLQFEVRQVNRQINIRKE